MYTYQVTIRLHEIDAAGVIFYGHIYRLIHDCFESFLSGRKLDLVQIITAKNYALPIVHAEADYNSSIQLGDRIQIQLNIDSISEHSFTISYLLTNQSGIIVASAKTVHVTVDKQTGTSIPIPIELKSALT